MLLRLGRRGRPCASATLVVVRPRGPQPISPASNPGGAAHYGDATLHDRPVRVSLARGGHCVTTSPRVRARRPHTGTCPKCSWVPTVTSLCGVGTRLPRTHGDPPAVPANRRRVRRSPCPTAVTQGGTIPVTADCEACVHSAPPSTASRARCRRRLYESDRTGTRGAVLTQVERQLARGRMARGSVAGRHRRSTSHPFPYGCRPGGRYSVLSIESRDAPRPASAQPSR